MKNSIVGLEYMNPARLDWNKCFSRTSFSNLPRIKALTSWTIHRYWHYSKSKRFLTSIHLRNSSFITWFSDPDNLLQEFFLFRDTIAGKLEDHSVFQGIFRKLLLRHTSFQRLGNWHHRVRCWEEIKNLLSNKWLIVFFFYIY